jgi:hypothetical protein
MNKEKAVNNYALHYFNHQVIALVIHKSDNKYIKFKRNLNPITRFNARVQEEKGEKIL